MGFTTTNTENFEVYLTPFAREKLYTGKGGKINIKYFSLHDGDINYTKSAKTQSFSTTPAGKYTTVPNLRGEPTEIGVNGCQVYQLDDFILRKDIKSDEKCPDGYYKNEIGECIEKIFNPTMPQERKIINVNNNTMSTKSGPNNKIYLKRGQRRPNNNSRTGKIPGGSSY